MKAFVTGATGFIGSRLSARLRERGDEVVALVRSPRRAAALERLGCRLVEGDLSSPAAIESGVAGCDSVFHVAADYRVGIDADKCRAMHEANVAGTARVLDAAAAAGAGRIVYVSTIGYFGNTHGEVVDEDHERRSPDFLSCYDETKYLAHEIAKDRIARGAPVLVAQPGGVYGPGDRSAVGNFIEQTRRGRMKLHMFPETGFNLAHVDDIVDGLLLVHDKGKIGEAYVLGGEISTMGNLVEAVARLSGRKPPTRQVPPALIRAGVPLGRWIGPMLGLGKNMRELVRASDGVTYWASDAKARRELHYSSRGLEEGLRALLAETP